MHEYDRLALPLVDVVHPVPRRGGEKSALERIHVAGHPVRTRRRYSSVHPVHTASSFVRQPVQALHMFVPRLFLREPGMRQGQARPAAGLRLEFDGDESFDVAALPAPGMHQPPVRHDFAIPSADEPSPSVHSPYLDQESPADLRFGDRANDRGIAGGQPAAQHLRLGPRGVDRFHRCVDHSMQR